MKDAMAEVAAEQGLFFLYNRSLLPSKVSFSYT
jgi:hypothetical protein